jgi:integrase
MVEKRKLTNKHVASVPVPERGEAIYRDDALTGFALRVWASGKRKFIYEYKRQGRKRRVTLGAFPDALNATQARAQAKKLAGKVAAGEDPAEEHRKQLDAPTVAELSAWFFRQEAGRLRPATAERYQYHAQRFVLPAFGKKKAKDVKRADVKALMRKMAGTPIQANRVLAFTKRLFSVAVNEEVCERNPCKGIEKYPEEARERYLSDEEVQRFTAALDAEPNQDAANAYRLLILTGARSGEVRTARWEMFDLGAGTWTKPGATTKQKTTHHAPLMAPAIALLRQMAGERDDDSPYLFPSPENPEKPRYGFKRPWNRIRRRAGIEDVRTHDLRHTFASGIVSNGASLAMVGALLGHTQHQTTMRYAHLMQDPLRQAVDQLGAKYTRLAEGRDKAEVIPLSGKAANDGSR